MGFGQSFMSCRNKSAYQKDHSKRSLKLRQACRDYANTFNTKTSLYLLCGMKDQSSLFIYDTESDSKKTLIWKIIEHTHYYR
ncbi:unnamed protein product [Blepharisma stoltei]|uniref:Uncharacterized protein n=1 Tax=Blepharisma stoltei TaxID=1481888 RepID=A0AAU9KBD7_9CILI|nr:unnamed protein product [Blepharisma stoltei]